jgi:hypothetical protein
VDDEEKRQIWRSLAEGLRAGDAGTHLVAFHPRGGDDAESTSSHAFPNPDPLLDFNMRQNGHGDRTKTWQRIADVHACSRFMKLVCRKSRTRHSSTNQIL